MSTALIGKDLLLDRIAGLQQIPTLPAVLAPLLRYLDQPIELLDVQKLTDFLAQDESLAAQCLRMANSPLFGRPQKLESLQGAVFTLGIHRIGDIAMSCGVLKLLPRNNLGLDPVVLWEHSLGCALICRRLAQSLNLADPNRAYLAGLLHDLGIIVNLWILPREFRDAFAIAREEGIPLHETEQQILGFTHCDTGRLLAERWNLAPSIIEVVAHHHAPEKSFQDQSLVALVHVADLLCRVSGLNYGYAEQREVNLSEDAGFALLTRNLPSSKQFDWARLTFELDSCLDEVHAFVHSVYRQ
jgi:HD-like signal output (HDOD) protein